MMRTLPWGAWGALIMGFFGAVFASMALYWQWHLHGVVLALPFLGFILIGIAANHVIRMPGKGITPSPREERAIMASSIGEGVGLFLAANIVINLHRPDLLLPSMALIVGAIMGFIVKAPTGGALAGGMAAGALWLASSLALRRDRRAKAHTA